MLASDRVIKVKLLCEKLFYLLNSYFEGRLDLFIDSNSEDNKWYFLRNSVRGFILNT